MVIWRTHFEEIVTSIQDPDALAEEACKAGLIPLHVKEMLINTPFPDGDSKVMTILLTIEGRIKDNPQLFRTHLMSVLRKQPGLDGVVSTLQASYGESLNYMYMSTQCTERKCSYLVPGGFLDFWKLVKPSLKLLMSTNCLQSSCKTSVTYLALSPGSPNLHVRKEIEGEPGMQNHASDIICRTALYTCLLYTSPSPRDATLSRMPSSA